MEKKLKKLSEIEQKSNAILATIANGGADNAKLYEELTGMAKEIVKIVGQLECLVVGSDNLSKVFCIVRDQGDDIGTDTLESYNDLDVARKAFNDIKVNGYHVCENDDEQEKVSLNKGDSFTLISELWDQNNEIYHACEYEEVIEKTFTL